MATGQEDLQVIERQRKRYQLLERLNASPKIITKRGLENMKTRNFLNMSNEEREAYLNRNEVKSFYDNLRTLSGAKLLLPQSVSNIVKDGLLEHSKLLKHVWLKPIRGGMRQILATDTLEAVWTEWGQQLENLNLSLSSVEVDSYLLGGFISVPNSELEDTRASLANDVEYMLAKAIGYAIDRAIIYGKGDTAYMPTGFATTLPAENVCKIDGASLEGAAFYKAILKELAKVKSNQSQKGIVLAMNETTWKDRFLPEAITLGLSLPSDRGGFFPALHATVELLDFIPDGDVVGGYLEKYLLGEGRDITIQSSNQALFVEDETIFKGVANYDGLPVKDDSFMVLNINNQEPATSVTFPQEELAQEA